MSIEATRDFEFEGQRYHLSGWRKNLPDERDQKFQAVQLPADAPRTFTLREFSSRIENQKSVGCCTGEMLSTVFEIHQRVTGHKPVDVSALFAYREARRREGTPIGEDSGAMCRTLFQVGLEVGLCLDTTWPFSESAWFLEPPQDAYSEAAQHKIIAYRACGDLNAIKAALLERRAVGGGFRVPYALFDHEPMRTGRVPLPDGRGYCGGHAVTFIGYDDDAEVLEFQNSWGVDAGDHGYFYLPYWYVDNGIADDFACIVDQQYFASREPVPDATEAAA